MKVRIENSSAEINVKTLIPKGLRNVLADIEMYDPEQMREMSRQWDPQIKNYIVNVVERVSTEKRKALVHKREFRELMDAATNDPTALQVIVAWLLSDEALKRLANSFRTR